MNDPTNVYDPPAVPTERRPHDEAAFYSGFTKGWIITDLVFAGLRVCFGLLSLVGLSVLPPDSPLHTAALAEIGTNFGIAIFGILGNVLLLMRKQVGVLLGVLDLVFSALGIGVGIWEAIIQIGQSADDPKRIGMIIGATAALLIRVVLNVCYAIALRNAARRLAAVAPASPAL